MAQGTGIQISSRELHRQTRKIQRSLRRLGKESRQRTVIRRSLGPATTPMNKQAKANAPVGRTGQYKKSIGKKERVYPGSGSVIVVIGPRDGFRIADSPYGGAHNPSVIGHLLEFGHGGPRPAPARPHLRPAFESTRSTAQRIFNTKFWVNFRKELARVRSK